MLLLLLLLLLLLCCACLVTATTPLMGSRFPPGLAGRYGTYGPYRATYRMRPLRAFKNSDTEWSVKFRVSFFSTEQIREGRREGEREGGGQRGQERAERAREGREGREGRLCVCVSVCVCV